MKYFVYNHERQGTCYHEFYKGKWENIVYFNPESIFLDDDELCKHLNFVDAIRSVVPEYDPYGETEITKEQWNEIGKNITDEQSKELYDEANEWLNTIWDKYPCFTILGL